MQRKSLLQNKSKKEKYFKILYTIQVHLDITKEAKNYKNKKYYI